MDKYKPRRAPKAPLPSIASSEPSNGVVSQSAVPLSFAPAHMRKRKRVKDDDDVEDIPEKPTANNSVAAAPHTLPTLQQHALVSTIMPPFRNNRRTKRIIGPWHRRLEALQNARSNDAVRLQNEAFRRHTSFEMNDYRKKSQSHTDVTILGECTTSLVGSSSVADSSRITVLAYIHSHKYHQAQQQEQVGDGMTMKQNLEHQLTWATFAYSTARSINLQKGKQLRLYNAVILPCPQSTVVEGLAIKTLQSNVCERIIVSTWLCENHPEGLPKLSQEASRPQSPSETLVVAD